LGNNSYIPKPRRFIGWLKKSGLKLPLYHHRWKGGGGALELADAAIAACNEPKDFKFLYGLKTRNRVENNCR
jgi:formate--tetrahydrofolate ligase